MTKSLLFILRRKNSLKVSSRGMKRSKFSSKGVLYLLCREYICCRKRRVKTKRLGAAIRERKKGWDLVGSGGSDSKWWQWFKKAEPTENVGCKVLDITTWIITFKVEKQNHLQTRVFIVKQRIISSGQGTVILVHGIVKDRRDAWKSSDDFAELFILPYL